MEIDIAQKMLFDARKVALSASLRINPSSSTAYVQGVEGIETIQKGPTSEKVLTDANRIYNWLVDSNTIK